MLHQLLCFNPHQSHPGHPQAVIFILWQTSRDRPVQDLRSSWCWINSMLLVLSTFSNKESARNLLELRVSLQHQLIYVTSLTLLPLYWAKLLSTWNNIETHSGCSKALRHSNIAESPRLKITSKPILSMKRFVQIIGSIPCWTNK